MKWTVHGERMIYESPWVNLALADIEIPGGARFDHHVIRMPAQASGTVIDVADRGGTTLEEVGAIMNLTRERIRQVEVKGLAKLQALSDMNALRDYVDEGPVGKRRLPVLTKPVVEEEDDEEETTDEVEKTEGEDDFNVEEFASDALGE